MDTKDPTAWGVECINQWNRDRPNQPRELVEVRVEKLGGFKEHLWEKTNLVTIGKGGVCYDTARCARCFITGKRYGIGRVVTLDKKYADDEVYRRCDTSWLRLINKGRVRKRTKI